MPIYRMRCESCGVEDDVFCKIAEREDQTCENVIDDDPDTVTYCEGSMKVVITGEAALVGAMHSKPIDFSKQLGRVFTTNAEYRQYQKENPNTSVLTRADPELRKMQDVTRERMETTAKKLGYSSHEQKVSDAKAGKPAPHLR